MNTEEHDTPPTIVTLLSDGESDDDSIGDPQVSQREPLGDDGPPASPIPPEPPPQKSSQKYPQGSQSEEDPEGATPGRPIWEHDKKNRFKKIKPS